MSENNVRNLAEYKKFRGESSEKQSKEEIDSEEYAKAMYKLNAQNEARMSAERRKANKDLVRRWRMGKSTERG